MNATIEDVDYLIIGAGLAGTVVHRFLQSDAVVIVDPDPGAYKVGESTIPEQYHHPVLRELVPEIKLLPSYAPKAGSTFIGDDSVASFPLPPIGTRVAMHVERHELEQLMHRAWGTPVRREKVTGLDLDAKLVTTDARTYRVARQIIDCSGPAMVVARHVGDIEDLYPLFARWTYFAIDAIDDDAFWGAIRDRGMTYQRLDVPNNRLLPQDEDRGWEPAKTTILTQIREGVWTWRIPLAHHTVLSFGVVSRDKPVSEEELFSLAQDHPVPLFRVSRSDDAPEHHKRVHSRGRVARRARTPATLDYVLVSDAAVFGDPVYSAGGGMAVNKAIELAAILNEEGWTEHTCARWVTDYGAVVDRVVESFEAWYSGALLKDDAVAAKVANEVLQGTAFQVGVARHYSRVLIDAGAPADQEGPGGRGRHMIDPTAPPLTDRVGELLGLGDDGRVGGWTFEGAFRTGREVQHRWSHEGMPELVVNTSFDPKATRYFGRAGDVSLSFMNLWDGPYPMDDNARGLLEAVLGRIQSRESDWVSFGRELFAA